MRIAAVSLQGKVHGLEILLPGEHKRASCILCVMESKGERSTLDPDQQKNEPSGELTLQIRCRRIWDDPAGKKHALPALPFALILTLSVCFVCSLRLRAEGNPTSPERPDWF